MAPPRRGRHSLDVAMLGPGQGPGLGMPPGMTHLFMPPIISLADPLEVESLLAPSSPSGPACQDTYTALLGPATDLEDVSIEVACGELDIPVLSLLNVSSAVDGMIGVHLVPPVRCVSLAALADACLRVPCSCRASWWRARRAARPGQGQARAARPAPSAPAASRRCRTCPRAASASRRPSTGVSCPSPTRTGCTTRPARRAPPPVSLGRMRLTGPRPRTRPRH